jgi:PTH1 family peptidyl-tRNA hydrolase
MNESGLALKEVLSYLKIKPNETLIIHDEADLPFLFIKFTFNQSASMHKGVESIYKNCGNQIWRMRIGIQDKIRRKAEEIILKKLTKNKLSKWSEAKIKFKDILDKLNILPIEKISLPRDFFYK